MKTVIWARVSSREQKEGYSIDAQLRLARSKANRMGLEVVKEFTVAESARRGADRKEFRKGGICLTPVSSIYCAFQILAVDHV